MARSFILEQFTLDELVHERANAIASCRGALQDCFDGLAIGKAHRRAGREDHKLLDEIARDGELVLYDQIFELPHVTIRAAIRQCAGAVDRQSEIERECLAIHTVAWLWFHAFRHREVWNEVRSS